MIAFIVTGLVVQTAYDGGGGADFQGWVENVLHLKDENRS